MLHAASHGYPANSEDPWRWSRRPATRIGLVFTSSVTLFQMSAEGEENALPDWV